MMSSIDFSPLFRSTIGFDRVFQLLENSQRVVSVGNWPPYDIVREGEDAYQITLGVAGFSKDELTITCEPNLLVVKGSKGEDRERTYLHRGLTTTAFERRFELADYVEVTDANLENGLLTISLKVELPEAMKPRRIAISTGDTPIEPARQLESRQAA